jgi:hypothetical protein
MASPASGRLLIGRPSCLDAILYRGSAALFVGRFLDSPVVIPDKPSGGA